jgi:hypothetical protein
MIPEADVERVRRWCAERVPERVRDQIRIDCEVTPRHITIVERRPPWNEGMGPEWTRHAVARLRYTARQGVWTLYWRDSNSNFHEYDLLRPVRRVDILLAEVDRDPTAIFWG